MPEVVKAPARFLTRLRGASLLISTAAFALGVILQPTIAQLLGDELADAEKIQIGTAVLVAYTLVVAVAANITAVRSSRSHVDRILEGFERLERRTDMTVEFLERGGPNSDDPYDIVMSLMLGAEKEILVLDHRPAKDVDRFGSHGTLDDPSREAYYRLISQRVCSRHRDGPYVRYRRVVQLDSGPTAVWDAGFNGDALFAEHCREIVRLRSEQVQFPSAVKTSSVFLPNASMVIIDEKVALLEVAIVGPDGKARVQGDLVFHDPKGILAGPLKQLFDHIDSQSLLVASVEGGGETDRNDTGEPT